MSAVVLDFGSSSCKVGLAGESKPSYIFSSAVGIPKEKSKFQNTFYTGEILHTNRREFHVEHPINNGIIQDVSLTSALIKQSIEETDYQNIPVLMTEPVLNPTSIREKNDNNIFLKILSLFAVERINGLVIDSGATTTQIIPIYDGFVISPAMHKQYIGGNDLLEYLVSKISEKRGVNVTTLESRDFIENQVKKDCFVALDADDVLSLSNDPELSQTYHLPDGSTFTIEEERFLCPELLFRPNLFINDDEFVLGLDKATYQCCMKCAVDVRRRLFENIICVGGNTLYPGFAERIELGVKEMVCDGVSVKVESQEDREFSSWIGGSIFALLPLFQELSITRAEYEEFGVSVIGKKYHNLNM
ncbi:actin [Entamoeba marina]